MSAEVPLETRARVHAALGDPARLAIVDRLALSDQSPGELARALATPSNLLAHHLKVLEEAGVVERSRSEGDRRRTYVRLVPGAIEAVAPAAAVPAVPRVVFVCTHNSARSQLAAATWAGRSTVPVTSAGTHPSERVHPLAVTTARRHGLRLAAEGTRHVADTVGSGDLVVAVCDNAHEELGTGHLHWSVPDPVRIGTDRAFEHALEVIDDRVGRLIAALPPAEGHPA